MRRYHICGICETNEGKEMARMWREGAEDTQCKYKVVSAPPPAGVDIGSGVALVIRKEGIDIKDIDVIYRDPKGKSLAVNVKVGREDMCIIVTHLEHDEQDRLSQIRTLREAVHVNRGRKVVWMGDFNFVETPEVDTFQVGTQAKGALRPVDGAGNVAPGMGRGNGNQPSARLIEEFTSTCRRWGGLMDVCRWAHGEKRMVTRYRYETVDQSQKRK